MRIVNILFSPTGGTRKAAEKLTEIWGTETMDLMTYGADFSGEKFTQEDVVVFAVPSFGGRVPSAAAARFSRIRGNGAACVLPWLSGNRASDEPLAVMADLAKACGCKVTTAVAAVEGTSTARRSADASPVEAATGIMPAYATEK